MGIKDIIKESFLSGYAAAELTVGTILLCLLCTGVLAAYVFVVYRIITRNAFYNQNFNLSLIALSVITAAVILTIQSNIVVSLGMVGALSIVRFRTAVKDPLDLVFLFWSISIGIICGAGFALVAAISSVVVTVVILVASNLPGPHTTVMLVVNAASYEAEQAILAAVEEHCAHTCLRARTATKTSLNLAVEIQAEQEKQRALLAQLLSMEAVTSASLVEHEGDATV